MKKMFALLLVAVMVLGLFAACGKTPVDTTPKDTTPKDTTPGTTAPKDTTAPNTTGSGELNTDWIWEDKTMSGEITFAIPFKDTQGMGDMIKEFNESYPNIKVNLHTYSNAADGNVAANGALAAGEIDVIASFGLQNANTRWENGLLMDLTDMAEEEGIDLVEQWGWDCYTYDDKVFSFPCGGLSFYVSINMDAWKDAGLDKVYNGLPTEWTWDEYLEASKKMTKLNDDGTVKVYGGSDYHATYNFMYTICQVYGADIFYEADGTSSYDNPVALKALERELKAELVDKIWFPKAIYSGDGLQTQMPFCDGSLASAVTCNMTRFLHDTATYPDVNWITGFAPYPTEEKGQTNYMSGVTPFSHAGIAASITDEELPAAWAFLKWYSTYGVKYLVVAGHQPNWKGTDAASLVEIIYGSEEEAKKWIDVESFQRVVGVATNPSCAEVNLTAYTDVSGALTQYVMEAINGEISAAECLKQAAEQADAAIKDAG